MPDSRAETSFDRVLFATDFSPATEAAFSYATAIADRYGAKLYVAHVINAESFDLLESGIGAGLMKQAREEATRKISQLMDPLNLPHDRYEIVVEEGVIAEALAGMIDRYKIELAVVGTHGRRALKKLLLGSVAEEVFRMTPCPVLTVGPKAATIPAKAGPRHILYPLRFTPDTSEAARYAVSLAERYTAALTIMTVNEDLPAAESRIEEPTQPMERWIRDHVGDNSHLRGRIQFRSGFGPATDSIVDFAAKESVDIIVMSIRNLDPVMAARLSRSGTAHELVSRAPCPVLTIR